MNPVLNKMEVSGDSGKKFVKLSGISDKSLIDCWFNIIFVRKMFLKACRGNNAKKECYKVFLWKGMLIVIRNYVGLAIKKPINSYHPGTPFWDAGRQSLKRNHSDDVLFCGILDSEFRRSGWRGRAPKGTCPKLFHLVEQFSLFFLSVESIWYHVSRNAA
ncbi:hypothetical protein CEXT_550811 [Caerostris extrusa]|uniref:Uncharacterized protein n=1 Tax=Caerostris extrusa TaxID=172846 RepID=A0AAV4TWF6_CAEEX|nr:hypothetical protein CEXT_550811 [Caerostris extrusa]